MFVLRDSKTTKILGFWDSKTKTLIKKNLKTKHLFYKFGGVPAIECRVYKNLSVDGLKLIKCYCEDGRIFISDKDNFDKNKIMIEYGIFGKQYTMKIENWIIKKDE